MKVRWLPPERPFRKKWLPLQVSPDLMIFSQDAMSFLTTGRTKINPSYV
jgi:hypothetical protein